MRCYAPQFLARNSSHTRPSAELPSRPYHLSIGPAVEGRDHSQQAPQSQDKMPCAARGLRCAASKALPARGGTFLVYGRLPTLTTGSLTKFHEARALSASALSIERNGPGPVTRCGNTNRKAARPSRSEER